MAASEARITHQDYSKLLLKIMRKIYGKFDASIKKWTALGWKFANGGKSRSDVFYKIS